MGIAEIKQRILAEAEAEAKKIISAADQVGQALIAEAKKKAEQIRQERLALAAKEAAEARQQIVVPARLAAKKHRLEEQHRVLNEVFQGFSKKIREAKEIEVAKFIYG